MKSSASIGGGSRWPRRGEEEELYAGDMSLVPVSSCSSLVVSSEATNVVDSRDVSGEHNSPLGGEDVCV